MHTKVVLSVSLALDSGGDSVDKTYGRCHRGLELSFTVFLPEPPDFPHILVGVNSPTRGFWPDHRADVHRGFAGVYRRRYKNQYLLHTCSRGSKSSATNKMEEAFHYAVPARRLP